MIRIGFLIVAVAYFMYVAVTTDVDVRWDNNQTRIERNSK